MTLDEADNLYLSFQRNRDPWEIERRSGLNAVIAKMEKEARQVVAAQSAIDRYYYQGEGGHPERGRRALVKSLEFMDAPTVRIYFQDDREPVEIYGSIAVWIEMGGRIE